MTSTQNQRPQVLYRQRLLQALAASKPRRVLEVGCGGGGFLRSAASLGVELQGIDPEASSVAALHDEGFSVRIGRAECLEYVDGHFDAVVFCFAAHHIEDWGQALNEAMRVSRQAVFILDPWHESGIPGQTVAAGFDRWCKAIDRASGMVHNDCLSAAQLLEPVRDRLHALDVGINYMLVLHDLGVDRMLEIADEQLRKAVRQEQWKPDLAALVAEARLHGFHDDGAVLLSIGKRIDQ
jgi:ubiquinone/menaquinone biosynthesis C-methylase UbiE